MKRVVLVTGGMGGLGEAISTKLADSGYRVAVTYSPANKSAEQWLEDMQRRGYRVWRLCLQPLGHQERKMEQLSEQLTALNRGNLELTESNQRALAALDRMVKITPAGSEAAWSAAKVVLSASKFACDNALKSAKQFAGMAKANGEAVAERAAPESKRKAA